MQRKKKVIVLNEILLPNKWLHTLKHPYNFLYLLSRYTFYFLITILC